MPLSLYNTLTRQKEVFESLKPGEVTFYNCGPTVYDVFHVGNARNFVFADVLRRYLEFSGYKVRFVQNLTDVDDKIINRANEEGTDSATVANRNAKLYFKYADALNVTRAELHPKATEHIPDMIAMIERLIERGHAYAVDGDVFFDVASYKEYGRLSRKNLDQMREGARVDDSIKSRKKNAADFTLWKASKPGEPSWDSPWGEGRPGWHIECSAMSVKHLGETFDIHSGGADLAFPHHENEIAQSCCSTNGDFVRYWVHNGFITFGQSRTEEQAVDDEHAFTEEAAAAKVSKSTMTEEQKELFNIDKALERFGARALRFFLVSAQYRSPLAFSVENVEDAGRRADRIAHALSSTDQFLSAHPAVETASGKTADEFVDKFRAAMDDDLNTMTALAVLSETLSTMNQMRAELDKAGGQETPDGDTPGELACLRSALGDMLNVLGMTELLKAQSADSGEAESILAIIQALIDARSEARKAKNFAISDALRDRLDACGIVLEDGAGVTTFGAKDSGELPSVAELALLGIEIRQKARAEKSYEVADAIRDKFLQAGIALEDGASGTTWKRLG